MSLHKRIIIGLVLVGALLYAFNMGNVLFWDDADWIVNNPCVQEPVSRLSCLLTRDVLSGIGQTSNYYRPVLMLTFAFNWALGGDSPFGYHLFSNALHIANAILIFILLQFLFRNSSFGFRVSRIAPAIAALFWLIHPLQTEAVAYISGRGDPLSVFLMLLSFFLFLRTVGVPGEEGNGGARAGLGRAPSSQAAGDRRSHPTAGSRRAYLLAASILSAILAIFSRETAVLLPLYLTVTLLAFPEVSPLKEEKPPRFWNSLKRALVSAWPFYIVSVVYGILRLTVLNFANTLNWYAQSNIYTESVLVRIWTFLQVLWEYARLIIAPVGLHMERNVPVLTAPWQYPAFMGIGLLVLAAWWVVRTWRRGNRIPFFGVVMFLIPLAPSSGILAPINSLIYEHWLYFSLFGATALIAVYGVRLYEFLRSRSRILSTLLLAIWISYLGFLSFQTVKRNVIWGNPERLYLQILQYEPQNVRVLNNLANLYADAQKLDDAEKYWKRAAESDPGQPAPHHNLGNLERDRGNIDGAIALYSKALEVSPMFWYSYQNLAAMLLNANRPQEASAVLLNWQKANPSEPLTYYVLAQMLGKAGKTTEARAMLNAGLPAAQSAGPQYETAYQEMLQQL